MTDDVTTDNKIYDPNIHPLKGKTVRRQLMPVAMDYASVPPEILKENGGMMVVIDVMHTNKLEFVARTSGGIKFTTEEYVNGIFESAQMASIKKTINLYYKRIFKGTNILMYHEFEPM